MGFSAADTLFDVVVVCVRATQCRLLAMESEMAEPPGKIEPIRWDGPMPVPDRRGSKGRVGPLVTFVEHVRPGGVVRWGSRDHRKHPCRAHGPPG